jgi:hypothetical protein
MSKQKKQKKKAKKKNAIKVILSTDEETAADEEDIDDEEDDQSGMYLEKEDMLLIYKALKNYQPVNDDEEITHELLVEQFEEILIVDYKVKLRRSG